MSEFKDYSLPELYNTPSPQNPGQVNWTSVAIYTGIGVTCVIVCVVAIHYSHRSNLKFCLDHSERTNNLILAAIKKREPDISSTVPVLQKQVQRASVEPLPQETNFIDDTKKQAS